MPSPPAVFFGRVVLPHEIVDDGAVYVANGRIAAVGAAREVSRQASRDAVQHAAGGFIAPGFVDLHVHGGDGADFMDATPEAFKSVLACHARHGTTSIVPTTTVANHALMLRVLELCRQFKANTADQGDRPAGARVLGGHFYGPYFHEEAVGCHPPQDLRPPERDEYEQYLSYAESLVTATIAPELPGAESFSRACVARGVRLNVGHSQATFEQVRQAISWGATHVDHLFCAMSDKTKLRAKQTYPMQGGVLEATLFFDELTTEVIADAKHLSADLLQLALKIKGPESLALVTDCSRALDMPEGPYMFGPLDGGVPFIHRDGVGLLPDGTALASSATGMDHMLRTFHRLTNCSLPTAVRMATLTPARIAGWGREIGSLETGKRADIVQFDADLNVRGVWIDGETAYSA